jgi:hypothetical protein
MSESTSVISGTVLQGLAQLLRPGAQLGQIVAEQGTDIGHWRSGRRPPKSWTACRNVFTPVTRRALDAGAR